MFQVTIYDPRHLSINSNPAPLPTNSIRARVVSMLPLNYLPLSLRLHCYPKLFFNHNSVVVPNFSDSKPKTKYIVSFEIYIQLFSKFMYLRYNNILEHCPFFFSNVLVLL